MIVFKCGFNLEKEASSSLCISQKVDCALIRNAVLFLQEPLKQKGKAQPVPVGDLLALMSQSAEHRAEAQLRREQGTPVSPGGRDGRRPALQRPRVLGRVIAPPSALTSCSG